NLIALSLLKQHDIHVTFLEWMSYGVPISIFMLVGLLVLLSKRLKVETHDMHQVSQLFSKQLRELGPLKRSELVIAGVFFLAVLGWIAPDILTRFGGEYAWAKLAAKRLDMGAVALFCSLLLFISRDDEKNTIL